MVHTEYRKWANTLSNSTNVNYPIAALICAQDIVLGKEDKADIITYVNFRGNKMISRKIRKTYD